MLEIQGVRFDRSPRERLLQIQNQQRLSFCVHDLSGIFYEHSYEQEKLI